jgi:cysteine desulfuration protein SufE
MSVEDIREDFEFLEDWEQRYQYLIDLGKNLDALPDERKTEETLVEGCQSQVWIETTELEGDETRLAFRADSDAHIVKGLVAVLMELFSGKTPKEILAIDARAELEALGLEDHLSPTRKTGLIAMIDRIRNEALIREK